MAVVAHGFKVKHLLCVTWYQYITSGHIWLLCLWSLHSTDLGIPCCHYFQILTKVKGMKFNIGLIWERYVFCCQLMWNIHIIFTCYGTYGIKTQVLTWLLFQQLDLSIVLYIVQSMSTTSTADQAGLTSTSTSQPAATIISATASSNNPPVLRPADNGLLHNICYCLD